MTATALADGTALYRIWGEADLLLYIGVSKHFGTRWRQHAKRQPWWGEMRRLSVDAWYESRSEAEAAEIAAIKAEKPKYNKAYTEVAPGKPKQVHRRSGPTREQRIWATIKCVGSDGSRPWVPGFRGVPEAHDLFCGPEGCLGRLRGSDEEIQQQVAAAVERHRQREARNEARRAPAA